MRFLILFIFLTTNVFANDVPEIKNIVIHKDPKVYDNVIFLDKNDKKIDIKEFNGNLLLLNFWATWCAPCKEEMPSLDKLQVNQNLSNLKIFAINISQESKKKVDSFFEGLNIKNFYYKGIFNNRLKCIQGFLVSKINQSFFLGKKKFFLKVISENACLPSPSGAC